MTPTTYRDQVAELAVSDPEKGVEIARKITDPWFEAQAWAHLARHSSTPLKFSNKASEAAARTKDDYQRSAVRAWEIAALAERDHRTQARTALTQAVELASTIEHQGSRSEALLLLLQAAAKISKEDAAVVAEVIRSTCDSSHWRGQRAVNYASKMIDGEWLPREFFW